MRWFIVLATALLLSGCRSSSAPTARVDPPGCVDAFGAVKPEHAIRKSDAAVAAVVATCEYARIETQAMSECLTPIAAHAPGLDSIDASVYGLRQYTMKAVIDAEGFGYDLANAFETRRLSDGAALKSEDGCLILLDKYLSALAARESALRALGKAGGY